MQRQFLVPQFIDVEDKIIGPITTRQFVLLLLGTLLIFIEFQLAQFWLFLIESIITVIVVGIIAFLKINGMPFHYFLLNLLQTMKRAKLRVWNKKLSTSELKALAKIAKKDEKDVETFTPKKVSSQRLSKLSLIVNTGGTYKGDDSAFKNEEVKKPELKV